MFSRRWPKVKEFLAVAAEAADFIAASRIAAIFQQLMIDTRRNSVYL